LKELGQFIGDRPGLTKHILNNHEAFAYSIVPVPQHSGQQDGDAIEGDPDIDPPVVCLAISWGAGLL